MSQPAPRRRLSLGLTPAEVSDKPYGRFWNPSMKPLSEAARGALLTGPRPAPLLPHYQELGRMASERESAFENGFGFSEEGGLIVAIRTVMPEVTPPMVDWWFAWHNVEPQRYKLWHPEAHLYAAWDTEDDVRDPGYIGKTSWVDEYIGDTLHSVRIQFVAPRVLGFDPVQLFDQREDFVVIGARIAFATLPITIGTLVHVVQREGDGSVMRSRFFLGGPHARVGTSNGVLSAAASTLVRTVKRPTRRDGEALLTHCAEEMAHLASFLPELYRAMR